MAPNRTAPGPGLGSPRRRYRLCGIAETARRIPPVRVQGCYFNRWPAIRRRPWETWGASDIEPRPFPPPSAALERLWRRWLDLWLAVEERHLVWMRAEDIGWKVIARRFGCERTAAWRGQKAASDRSRRAQHGNVAKFCQNTYYHPMSSMNISLPDSLKAFVDEQVAQRGYGTGSEYVRELIRKDRDRMRLRELLLEGAATQPGGPADEAYFDGLRGHIRKRARG
jgi:antitoxin ParD1/3/4